MTPTKGLTLLSALELAMLCGCAVPGVPQPPSLHLPRRVGDLAATRKGDKVTLTWTPPRETTDSEAIRHPGVTKICRQVGGETMTSCGAPVGQVAPGLLPATGRASFQDVLPKALEEQNPTGFAAYAVECDNEDGRNAGLSNSVEVPLAPTLPAPVPLSHSVRADGVALEWTVTGAPPATGVTWRGRVYRKSKEAPEAVALGDVDLLPATITLPDKSESAGWMIAFTDRNIEWESTYTYTATAVSVAGSGPSKAEVEGEDSAPVEVFVHDIFPPAAPTGVQAVYSPRPSNFIDLTWAPNTESDLAGYNVYRHEAGATPAKINGELVKAPAFRDTQVEPGKTYFYSVTAVDLRNNESEKSAEASESVPKD